MPTRIVASQTGSAGFDIRSVSRDMSFVTTSVVTATVSSKVIRDDVESPQRVSHPVMTWAMMRLSVAPQNPYVHGVDRFAGNLFLMASMPVADL
jgi:hypothetical protein